MKLPPPQREPGTGPNPSGDRAPVTTSVPRTPKTEPAPAPAEAVASAPAATSEIAPTSAEPKKKKAAPKKKAPTATSTTPSEKPPTTPEIKIGDEVIWETNSAIQWKVPKKIKSIETYPTTGEKFALFEDVDTGIPLKELSLVTATTAPAPAPAEPRPVVPVTRPRAKLPSLPGRPAPAATPDAAPSAPVVPPEPAPATAPAVPPEVAPATTTPEPTAPPTPEPAPATPPATPLREPEGSSEPRTAETPPTPPTPERTSFFDSFTSSFRGAADRFMARFRGEVTARDEKDYKPTGGDVTKSIAAGLMSVVASYTGIKIVADLPEWLKQKYFTAQERKRIKEALKAKETELDVAGAGDALEAKKLKLEETINASKFLTKEKKAELLQKLKYAIEMRDAGVLLAREKRNKNIAEILDQAIQARIKGTQVLKETLNSALMVTGLSALRGAGYGAVALWERRARLMKDENFLTKKQARGLDRNVTFFNDLVIGGMKDTWKQLKGGGAETKAGKAINFVQGATVVMRAVGFTDLAINGIVLEGDTVSTIEATLKAWESKVSLPSLDNITAPWERLGSLFSKASHVVTGTPETPPVSGTDTGDTGADTSDAGTDSGAADGSSAPEAGGSAEPATSSVEYPESAIATGTVHKGDGIIEILQRQGLSAKAALAAAREAGIVRAGGDTRLATESIGRIAVVVHETDGHAIIWFHDAQTGNMLSLDEARAQGFTYEHGAGAPEVSEPPVAHQIETPSEVPHSLAGSKLTLNTIEGGYNIDMDPSGLTSAQLDGMVNASAIEMAATGDIAQEQEMVKELSQRMASTQTILERLDARHLGDSAEAQVLRQGLQQDLAQAQSMNVFDRADLQKIQAEANQFHADALQSVLQADRINDIRIPGLGKIEFTYDASGKPQFDLNQLITNAKPVLQMRAANMLVDGWQDSVAHAYILQQEMQIAGPVYLMNEALKELKAGGHGESAEAKFLTEQLDGYLRANADVLDGNNAIVKEAAEKAGVYTEIFTNS